MHLWCRFFFLYQQINCQNMEIVIKLILLTIDIDQHHFVLVAVCRPWHEPQLRVCVGLWSFVCVCRVCIASCKFDVNFIVVCLFDGSFFQLAAKPLVFTSKWFDWKFTNFVHFLQRAIFSKLASVPGGGSALRMSSLTRSSLYFSKQSLRLVVFIMAKHFILQDLFIFRLGLNVSFVVCQWYIWQDDICCMTWYHIVKKERRDLN